MFKKYCVINFIFLLLTTAFLLTSTSSITVAQSGLKEFNIQGYWSRSSCIYDIPMAYFSSDGSYEIRKKEKNMLSNEHLKYSVNLHKKRILIDGKKSFDIVSLDTIVDIVGNAHMKCDISESVDLYKKMRAYSLSKKSENEKNSIKYRLGSKNILGWVQIPDGIIFKLKPEDLNDLKNIMKNEKGKYISFYAGDILIDVVLIDKPLKRDDLYLTVDNEMSEKITNALKAEVKK